MTILSSVPQTHRKVSSPFYQGPETIGKTARSHADETVVHAVRRVAIPSHRLEVSIFDALVAPSPRVFCSERTITMSERFTSAASRIWNGFSGFSRNLVRNMQEHWNGVSVENTLPNTSDMRIALALSSPRVRASIERKKAA